MSTARPPIGVLLLQLGTPEAPTAQALRPYLRQFLSDRRVIELPRWKWLPILELFILTTRPRASAAKYARIWSAERGSPLRWFTERQTEQLQAGLGDGFAVEHGMRYGRPSIRSAVESLRRRGCDRLVALPMYPQYSATSTGTACDDLFAALSPERLMPALHVVPPYFDDEAYLAALEEGAREHLATLPAPPDHTLITFHGLPLDMVEKGDPYRDHCITTARLLADRLKLPAGRWSQTFQSRFGRAAWLEPYTEARLAELARQGVRRVQAIAPGFTADCLETLDEIGNEAAHVFRAAGGEWLSLAPCLNDHPAWIRAMVGMVRREAAPWIS